MLNIDFSNGVFPHMRDIANYHPSVIAWFDRLRLDNPYQKDFALACGQVVQQLEVPLVADDIAYTMFVRLVALINDRTGADIPAMSLPAFLAILESARADSRIQKHLGHVPLMFENGWVGELRNSLWNKGMREPELSIQVYKMAS